MYGTLSGKFNISIGIMNIDIEVLMNYGATIKTIKKGDFLYVEGDEARFYYQVKEGNIKVLNMNNEGKELIQGIYKDGESFGEPSLFIDRTYISSAYAVVDTQIVKLHKEKYLKLIDDYPEVARTILQCFAKRLYDKATTTQILMSHTPEDKIIGFLKKIKSEENHISPCLVPYTRQQIADFTGLRVETVIRTLSRLNTQQKVEIVNHKVYY